MNQQQRFMACKRWRWMPGMLTTCGKRVYDTMGSLCDIVQSNDGELDCEHESGLLPDLSDPATIGCILALVREAWGDPYLHCEFYPAEQGQPDLWMVMARHRQFVGATEAEALLVALEATPAE